MFPLGLVSVCLTSVLAGHNCFPWVCSCVGHPDPDKVIQSLKEAATKLDAVEQKVDAIKLRDKMHMDKLANEESELKEVSPWLDPLGHKMEHGFNIVYCWFTAQATVAVRR